MAANALSSQSKTQQQAQKDAAQQRKQQQALPASEVKAPSLSELISAEPSTQGGFVAVASSIGQGQVRVSETGELHTLAFLCGEEAAERWRQQRAKARAVAASLAAAAKRHGPHSASAPPSIPPSLEAAGGGGVTVVGVPLSKINKNRLLFGGYNPPAALPSHLLGEHLRTGGFSGFGDDDNDYDGAGGFGLEGQDEEGASLSLEQSNFAARRGMMRRPPPVTQPPKQEGDATHQAGFGYNDYGNTGSMSALAAAQEITGGRGLSASSTIVNQQYGSGGWGTARGMGLTRAGDSSASGYNAPRWAAGPPTAHSAEGYAAAGGKGPSTAAARERAALSQLLGTVSYEEAVERGNQLSAAVWEEAEQSARREQAMPSWQREEMEIERRNAGTVGGEIGAAVAGLSAYKTKSGFGASASAMAASLSMTGGGSKGTGGMSSIWDRAGRLAAERRHDRIDKAKKKEGK